MKTTYSFDEGVKYLKTSDSTLSVLLNAAQIAAAKIGQSWVIREDDLDAYLRSEVERQTLARLEQLKTGEKIKVPTAFGSKRKPKPNLDGL